MRDAAPPSHCSRGAQSVVWDGRLPHGHDARTPAPTSRTSSSTSAVGTSDLAVPFAFRRGSRVAAVTSWLAHYGVLAVFVLMVIDAVFPAASELVMVYARRARLGRADAPRRRLRLARDGLRRLPRGRRSPASLGYQLGSIVGWWIGDRGGRPFLERHGRWLHLTPEQLERAERWFERWDDWAVLRRAHHAGRALVHLDPGRRLREPVRAATTSSRCSATRSGASSSPASAGRSGASWETLPPRLPLRRDRRRRRESWRSAAYWLCVGAAPATMRSG